MKALTALILFTLLGLCSCGSVKDSQIVGLFIEPVSAASVVGGGANFSAYVQYVDGHKTPVSAVHWSIQGTASLIGGTGVDGSVFVNCVRRSDYFAGHYVGDTVMGKAEVNGNTYVGTASITCE